jgi:hypothetical protein
MYSAGRLFRLTGLKPREHLFAECSNSNESINMCGNRCERKCGEENIGCVFLCDPPACECHNGYVRHNGECITEEDCESLLLDQVCLLIIIYVVYLPHSNSLTRSKMVAHLLIYKL